MPITHLNHRISIRQWTLIGCLWALAGAAQDGGVGHVVDRLVASVAGKAITLSQLEFETRVMLVDAGAREAAFRPLDDEALRAGLEAAIDHRVATLEADKLNSLQLESTEVTRAVAHFRARMGSESELQRFLAAQGSSSDDLVHVLKRQIRASRALESRLRSKSQVSEAEARSYQQLHPQLAGVQLTLIREKLSTSRFQELMKQELTLQRRQCDVRFYGPYATIFPEVDAP